MRRGRKHYHRYHHKHYQKHDWGDSQPQQRPKARVKTSTVLVVWLVILALLGGAVFGIYKGVSTLVAHKDSITTGMSTIGNSATQTLEEGKDSIVKYKDEFTSKLSSAWQEWQAQRAAEEAAKKAAAEEETKKAEEAAEQSKKLSIEEMERSVVEQVNAIRAEKGIAPLVWDSGLYIYSKQHSEDMANQKRLFHTPVGASYAENAWGGEGSTSWTASTIVNTWMSSPPHRTWLLCPHLQHIAVGIAISNTGMYASWTFWVGETNYSDWWYANGTSPPDWWY